MFKSFFLKWQHVIFVRKLKSSLFWSLWNLTLTAVVLTVIWPQPIQNPYTTVHWQRKLVAPLDDFWLSALFCTDNYTFNSEWCECHCTWTYLVLFDELSDSHWKRYKFNHKNRPWFSCRYYVTIIKVLWLVLGSISFFPHRLSLKRDVFLLIL